jgi:hypothetical protein
VYINLRQILGSLSAVALAMLAGCGQTTSLPSYAVYEVNGKVLLANGRPLTGGWISFVPKGALPVTPSAEIRSDGTFSLVTGGSGLGAPPGDYKLRIEAPQFQQVASKAKRKPLFPTKYLDEDSSGLVVSVRADTNELEPIRLK